MKTKEEKKKSNLWFMLLVLLLISVILCISSFGIATWARYRTVTGGNVEAQIAKWSFKVNGEEEQFADIDLADTISFEHVENTTVAPGTYGSFDLEIDGRGSEVSLDYYIDMAVTNKPTNLRFYTDSNYTQAIELTVDNKMYLNGEFLVNDQNPMYEVKTIYWKWDYRTTTIPNQAVLNEYISVIPGLETLVNDYNSATGNSGQQEEIAMKINDKIDTQESGGQVIINVKVKGVQINPGFSAKGISITSSKEGGYEEGDTVNFSMEFTENVYADDNQTQITSETAPEVVVGFEGTSNASAPVAKVASLMSINLNIGAAKKKVATFVSASGNKINYTYTVTALDSGNFKIESITGKVYSDQGKEIDFGEIHSVPEIIGGTIVSDVVVTAPQIKVGSETIILTKENVVDYYGSMVTNYNCSATAKWRLFYVDFDGKYGDEGTIYLKADKVSNSSLNITDSVNSTSALNIMKDLNPDWAENDGVANENNEYATLWLCDENNWNNYKDANKAKYVIGAPSVEMWIDSYNEYHSKMQTSGYTKINCKWFDLTESEKSAGYQFSTGNNNNYTLEIGTTVLKSDCKNMYYKLNEERWLSSPSAYSSNQICYTSGHNVSYVWYTSNYNGLCPVASLKSGTVLDIYVPQIKVDSESIVLTKENAADYYGKVVTNYSAEQSATWRIFYVDFDGKYGEEGVIYLKADQVKTSSLNITDSVNSTSALDRAKKMNSYYGNYCYYYKDYNSGKAVLWLCDESKWSAYKDSEKAICVLGAPSIRMYADSYNEYHSKKRTSGYSKLNMSFANNGYRFYFGDNSNNAVSSTASNSLKTDENNMYIKSGEYWWLASQSYNGSDYNSLCCTDGSQNRMTNYTYSTVKGICPIAILKLNTIPELQNE